MTEHEVIVKQLQAVQNASRKIVTLNEETINGLLVELADRIPAASDAILEANRMDLERMDPADPRYDRLLLNEARLNAIASDLRNVAALPSPLNRVLEERTLPNGLELQKVSVPLGVVGIIYESRPNVTFDVFALCLKSGNATVLKGGSDAAFSNIAIVNLIQTVIRDRELDPDMIYLLPAEREAAHVLLNAVGYIDVIIPRGSQALIDFARKHSTVPVIETGAGIVHTYFDQSGDLTMGRDIIFNAKTRRPSVCNALDTLIVHESRIDDLPVLVELLEEKLVQLYADEPAYYKLLGRYPDELLEMASPEHFGTEFLSLKMSIKTVANLEEALDHIARHSSKHSEAIIASDQAAIDAFMKRVDAAAVYANTSTAFTDGAQFGLGAEIGISTQKLHARGPMALKELCSYKWLITGQGQVRPA
ncbi:glutamate-5-semialdehyde dehydrogenase [Chlorobaculum sp. MV4-Y]|jgi:glutamate-5-semialdehyde dehydrogenase|uniref:glutamate-5-semialdehyde dehydrogenase n=1 Tax=Chlorobaculum sp. MV4-Y TaxID=2976335 RepID=UPI0021AF9FA9|nr:glutamate-5-semialdehyde dehydrogenase [Chlorobaculum sp. MV4-Y]UWX56804.1 glutamate-5-semialdehyde dehydrogenase [Chlorobaculum sp. MV4-Y]